MILFSEVPEVLGSKVIWHKNEENLRDLEFEIKIFSISLQVKSN